MPEVIALGEGDAERRIAVLARAGSAPPVVWFGGFRSDMRATKAAALDEWAATAGQAFIRFDYSGHGESSGQFEHGTISRWLEDGLAVLAQHGGARPILVGSSMGAWIALLATLRLRSTQPDRAPGALILIAPAIDFTEALMWERFSPETRHVVETSGVFMRPSDYGAPYPITRDLIADGRRHLLLNDPIVPGCPIYILQGMRDPDVPWEHALKLVERLPGDDVHLTFVEDGDHRLSRPQDIEGLVRIVEAARHAASTADRG